MSDEVNQGSFDIIWDEIRRNGEIEQIEADKNFFETFGIVASDFDGEMQWEEEKSTVTQTEKGGEFAEMSTEDVKNCIEGEDNKNTVRKTLLDVKKFERFLITKGESRQIHELETDHLDEYLANFVLSVRRNDGKDFETSSLRNIISSIDRKLKRQKYPHKIMDNGPAFQLTRDALRAKQKSLKKAGKGNKPKVSEAITDEEIEILYEKRIIGGEDPTALLNTMWLNNTIQFGLRGTQENYNLRWGDVHLKTSSDGTEFLELRERQTKTRTGENVADVRKVTPKIYSTGGASRDPIDMYKLYSKNRPENYCHEDDPFYLAPRTIPVTSSNDQWFLRSNVGARKLSYMLKTMAERAGLSKSKRLTNHSARKHLVQKLRDSGVPPTDIMQVSGHKNIQSILTYSSMSENKQKLCSNLLSNTSTMSTGSSSSIAIPSATVSSISNSESVGNDSDLVTRTFPSTVQSVVHCDYPTHAESLDSAPTSQSVRPINITSGTNQQYVKSIFAGATVNIQNFNMYTK